MIYARVSTTEQTFNFSLQTQRKACERYCADNGLEVAEVFIEEGASAKTANRPELLRLLDFCRENAGHIQHVVVYRIDRFARNHYDHAALGMLLNSSGVTLRSATELIENTPTGRFLENVLASVAQLENDNRAERTKDGMKAALRDGRWTFGVPIGYRRIRDPQGHVSIAPDPTRGHLVRDAFALFASGGQTKAEVLRIVTAMGLRTRSGKPLSMQTFHETLRKPIYKGVLSVPRFGIDGVTGDFEALVPAEVFDRVQDLLDGRRPALTPRQRNHPDFPLRHFVACGACGTPLTASWSKGRAKPYPYYFCRKRGCRAVKLRKEELETRFIKFLGGLTPKPEYLRLFRETVLDAWRDKQADATRKRAMIGRQLESLQEREDRLVEAFLHRQVIDEDTYRRQAAKLQQDKTLAEMELRDASTDELDVEGVLAFAVNVLGDAARLWMEASTDQKQRLQQVLFPKEVTYLDGLFRTTETATIFRLSQPIPGGNSGETSPTGFEPVLPA